MASVAIQVVATEGCLCLHPLYHYPVWDYPLRGVLRWAQLHGLSKPHPNPITSQTSSAKVPATTMSKLSRRWAPCHYLAVRPTLEANDTALMHPAAVTLLLTARAYNLWDNNKAVSITSSTA